MIRLFAAIALAFSALTTQATSAAGQSAESEDPSPSLNYLWDGGALPFVYGSGVLTLGLRLFVDPPDSPRLFPGSEGGGLVRSDTVPEVGMAGLALSGVGLIAAIPGRGRWYHLKGYGQAVLTTLAITEIAKNTIGRHRPTFSGDLDNLDSRRSFFSGHSSLSAATAVYLGLYLGRNVLPHVAGSKGRVYAGVATIGLAGIAIGIPASRLHDNRHHLSDILTGSVVGAATAVGFYAYQQTRFLRDRDSRHHNRQSRLLVLPDLANRGVSVHSSW